MAAQSRLIYGIGWIAAASLYGATALAATDADLLEPDQAFKLSTRTVDDGSLEASWEIAPGYYMYRDKFKFELLDGAISLKPAQIPPGKVKEDPLFGKVETYTKSVRIKLPVERKVGAATTALLRITSQGCNEPIGVCYPPIKKEIRFQLPVAAATVTTAVAASERAASGISSLKDLVRRVDGGVTDGDVVDPEKAFLINASSSARDLVEVTLRVDECCYLYRDKTSFSIRAVDGKPLPAAVRLAAYELPPGKIKEDEFFGKVQVYTRDVAVKLPIEGIDKAATPLLLTANYQGCAEKPVAICYPPSKKLFHLTPATSGVLAVTAIAPAGLDGFASSSGGAGGKTLSSGFVLAVLGAFGVGLLLTFTPCVLPMIPILSSVIVGSSDRQITKLEGGVLSISYVLGTAVTYTAAGVLAGATGDQLQAYFQNVWAIGVFAAILGLLALSMFGFYELQMPSFVQSRLHVHSSGMHSRFKHLKGGASIGVFIMGLVSALIVGACVSPLLISVLGVAIANRDPVLGGAIMFSMALGMGVILIAIGFGAGFLLPKAGPWMDRIKHVFGVLLIGVAIYLLGFLPQVPVLFLWAALFIITGVYMGATQSLPKGSSGWEYFSKGIGTFLLVWGALALIGGFMGNRDVLNPLPMKLAGVPTASAPASANGASTGAAALGFFTSVRTLSELEARLSEAKAAGKPAILDYYATWCTDCVRMEQSTFADPAVRDLVRSRFVALQADVTDPTDQNVKDLKKRFGVFGPPAMLFFDAGGAERQDIRTYGFKSPADFLALLNRLL